MYLAEIHIQNFRNLEDLTVKLVPGLNVILGENNIGKTNILDAVRVALGPTALAGNAPRLSEEDICILPNGASSDKSVRIDLLFKGLSVAEQAEFLDCLNYDTKNPEGSTASIHYEWRWSSKSKRWHHRRWGSQQTNTEGSVPDENLQSIKVILLDALRDASRELAPGRESRLGRLLTTVANEADRSRIERIFREANEQLESDEQLIKRVEKRIGSILLSASRNLSQASVVRASDTRFDRIVAGLRLLVNLTGTNDTPVLRDLRSNGLGYNNLLFIGTVLAELESAKDATLPILLVEEPEAHLHPQLQTLLADFLGNGASASDEAEARNVQTIITTHSPTIASHVPPEVIRVLHRPRGRSHYCVGIGDCGLAESEMSRLRHMLDATRAALLFARGVILVEGISEQILIPVLARRMKIDLAAHGVSVVNIAGVSFKTIAYLFGPEAIQIPVAIVTDGDPQITYADPKNPTWRTAMPERNGSGFVPGPRLRILRAGAENSVVQVFASHVTLEHDLAAAGDYNPAFIYDTWAGLYDSLPKSLTKKDLESNPTVEAKALSLWRAICVTKPVHGKAELAQALAEILETRDPNDNYMHNAFAVPGYIKEAIEHVLR